MNSETYSSWFQKVTGHPSPRDWQVALARMQEARSRLIRIPTGMGKTEGVISAWSYHRVERGSQSWPRRLVWCLPMRVLVEQTRDVAESLAAGMNKHLADDRRVGVHTIMGGEETDDWFLHPERPAIIVGTQDMLLSRAMNRGYGSSRARWPMEFGLLSHDALWVMDEVQLMDVGLATSAQLQAFRESYLPQVLRPCITWWMSATLQPDWLKSVDTQKNFAGWSADPCTAEPQQRNGGLFEISKSLERAEYAERDSKGFAGFILDRHRGLEAGEHGRVTLVVCNTVRRACETFDEVAAQAGDVEVRLVHSRFRPAEREQWRSEFLCRDACNTNADRIIVASQVVEAGVDISAGCMITELAPWPSLVQRFGRCARYGGQGQVIVVDRQFTEKNAAPYQFEELESASSALEQLSDVGLTALEDFEESLDDPQREQLYPYKPEHLLMESEFEELFDTTPDLTGADIDVSRFIRSGDERDLQVFWVDLEKNKRPNAIRTAGRAELCAVPFLKARDWLCGSETKSTRKPSLTGRMKDRVWVWDWIDGDWRTPRRSDLLPGRIVCVASDRGGYRLDRGFDPESKEKVAEVKLDPVPEAVREINEADGRQDSDRLSFNGWKTIAFHCRETAETMESICGAIGLNDALTRILVLAARWHDVGKSHPAFQNMLRRRRADVEAFSEQLLAKSDDAVRQRPKYFADDAERDERVGFRHELASALALFAILEHFEPRHPALLGDWADWLEEQNELTGGHGIPAEGDRQDRYPALVRQVLECAEQEFDLLVYLLASHHGKVRAGLHASPSDQDFVDRLGDGRGLPIRGVREGDVLPPLSLDADGPALPALELTLQPAAIGLSNRTGISWRERTLRLQSEHGPARLAYLEGLLRAADVRASQLKTEDPGLKLEAIV